MSLLKARIFLSFTVLLIQTHAASVAHQQNIINRYSTPANARAQFVIFTRIGNALCYDCTAEIDDFFDSLTTWLTHSKKKHCDVCKHPYSFTKGKSRYFQPFVPLIQIP